MWIPRPNEPCLYSAARATRLFPARPAPLLWTEAPRSPGGVQVGNRDLPGSSAASMRLGVFSLFH
jgi:hypothetical protein